MQERQLDRVGDLLDLAVEAADVVVGDVGDLFEHEVRRPRAGQLLEQHARARVHEDGVAAAQPLVTMMSSASSHDPLFVGPADDERTPAVGQDLFDGDDLAGGVGAAREHDRRATR